MDPNDAWWDEMFANPSRIDDELEGRTWSGWRGAYRVVTDGDRIVAESEEAVAPDHGRGHPDLKRDFALKYPDAEAHLSGWLIPTADGSGYGLMLYWGSEPERERARAAAEAWIGKDVHLVDDVARYTDPALYAIYPEGGHAVDFPNEQ